MKYVLGFLLLNGLISTIWLGEFDNTLGEKQERFEAHEWGTATCIDSKSLEDELLTRCFGGIFEERDAYLRDHNILAWGNWRISYNVDWCDQRDEMGECPPNYMTRQWYIRYWF